MTRDGLLGVFLAWDGADDDYEQLREYAHNVGISDTLLAGAYEAYLERELIHSDPESWVSDHFDDSTELVLADSDLALDDALDAVLRDANEAAS